MMVIVIVIVYLTIRYIIKKNRDKDSSGNDSDDDNSGNDGNSDSDSDSEDTEKMRRRKKRRRRKRMKEMEREKKIDEGMGIKMNKNRNTEILPPEGIKVDGGNDVMGNISDGASYYQSVTELPELEPVHMGNGGDDDSIYNLEKSYRIDKENGNMSDQMLKDLYQKKNQKMSFDELARVVAGN